MCGTCNWWLEVCVHIETVCVHHMLSVCIGVCRTRCTDTKCHQRQPQTKGPLHEASDRLQKNPGTVIAQLIVLCSFSFMSGSGK